jgi:hypothetical protein
MAIQKSEAVLAMERRIREKAAQFHELLNNPVGRQLITILTEEFDKLDLRGATVEETYYNLGCRDVVVYLQTLQRIYDADPERDIQNAT